MKKTTLTIAFCALGLTAAHATQSSEAREGYRHAPSSHLSVPLEDNPEIFIALSNQELEQFKGGQSRFAPITRNQATITAVGFLTHIALTWPVVTLVNHLEYKGNNTADWAKSLDHVVCGGGGLVAGGLIGQSQISAGRVDNRNLGAADVLLAMQFSLTTSMASVGCSIGFSHIHPVNAARGIVAEKDGQWARQPTQEGRRMLMEKWNATDSWAVWALAQTEQASDKFDAYADARDAWIARANSTGCDAACRQHAQNMAHQAHGSAVSWKQEFFRQAGGLGKALWTHGNQLQAGQQLAIMANHTLNHIKADRFNVRLGR